MQQKKHLTKIEIQVVILKIGMCIWRAVYCLGFLLFSFSFFFKLGNVVLEKKKYFPYSDPFPGMVDRMDMSMV